MRYREIIERSVRMGAKDLASTKTEGFLVGFEFEIACHPSLAKKDKTDARYEFNDMSDLHPLTSFEEWLAQNFNRDPAQMINHYDMEPVRPITAGDMWEEDGEDPDEEPEDMDEVVPGKYFDGRYIRDYDEVEDEDTLDRNFIGSGRAIRDYENWVESEMDRAFQDWYDELDYDQESTENSIEDVYDVLSLPFDIVFGGDYTTSEWGLKEDISIKPAGAELVSPPLPVEEAISAMYDVLDQIDGKELFTNNSTGLHINVSVPEPDQIDLLKLLLFMGEGYVLDMFNRKGNKYTKPLLDEVVKYLKTREGDINKTIDAINAFMVENAHHYRTIDINKLAKGYLEFRAGGNAGYEDKGKDIEDLIRRYVRIITLASDPDAEREAYLKKLYQVMTKPNYEDTPWQEIGLQSGSEFYEKIKSDPAISYTGLPVSPLFDSASTVHFFNNMTVEGTPSRTSLVLFRKIIQKMKDKITSVDWRYLKQLAEDENYPWLTKLLK